MKKDIQLAFEVGALKFMERAWKQSLQMPVENILEHTIRVMLLSLIIARHEGVKDERKIMLMVLLHDMAESRTLDTAFFHKEYIERFEEKAQKDMFAKTSFEQDADILKEYHERQSIESKIVRDADQLEVDFELKELVKRGSEVAKKYHSSRTNIRKNKLHTKTAKKIWDELQKADPDEWHLGNTNDWIKSKKFK